MLKEVFWNSEQFVVDLWQNSRTFQDKINMRFPGGETTMIRTISIGSCVSIQGLFVSQLSDGKIVVKVDEKTFIGYPVVQQRAS
jgi:hypothetical protein